MPLPRPERSAPLDRPRDWPCCDRSLSKIAERPRLGPGDFHGCLDRVLAAPVLTLIVSADPVTYSLTWALTEVLDAPRFLLEEASRPDFSGAAVVYDGTGDRIDFYGRRPGDYYYRVRVFSGGNDSDWSTGVAHRVPAAADALLSPPAPSTTSSSSMSTGRCSACARRAATSSRCSRFPSTTRGRRGQPRPTLTFRVAPGPPPPFGLVPPLGGGEERALSYAGLLPSVGNRPRGGGGVAAAAAATRRSDHRRDGAARPRAWSVGRPRQRAAARRPRPHLARRRRRPPALFDAQVNLLLQEPEGFLTLSADTLSADADLRPINVRRLLQLLRRLALRDGQAYVFEPNDARFRRIVQRGFETVLGYMFDRGAFAGTTQPRRSRSSPATKSTRRGSVDVGRFFVELKVAPSRPLAFLTVRLVQTAGPPADGRGAIDGQPRAGDHVPSVHDFNFAIEINVGGDAEPLCNASFSDCDGLEMTMDVKTIREGGNNGRQIRLPGPATFGTLTLKRGMTAGFGLWRLVGAHEPGPEPAGQHRGRPLRLRRPDRARPLRPRPVPARSRSRRRSLNAKDGTIAIEELQVAYEATHPQEAREVARMAEQPKVTRRRAPRAEPSRGRRGPRQQGPDVQFNPETLKVSFANQVVPPANEGRPRPARHDRPSSTWARVRPSWRCSSGSTSTRRCRRARPRCDDVRELTKKVAYFITPKPLPTIPPRTCRRACASSGARSSSTASWSRWRSRWSSSRPRAAPCAPA